MAETETEQYLAKIIQYEQHLKTFLEENYQLKINFLTVMNWGYTTTAYYIESNNGNFVARISTKSKEKQFGLVKDIQVSNILSDILPIPIYSQAKNGEYLLDYVDENKNENLLRVSNHVQGVLAFSITTQNLVEMALFLKKLHWELPEEKLVLLRQFMGTTDGHFVHGDLTPTNTLLHNDKIIRFVDFENSSFGYVENDLARTAVFSWFHLNELDFDEILATIQNAYGYKFDLNLFFEFGKEHLLTHLKNVENSKDNYEDLQKFDQDLDFSKKMSLLYLAYLKSKGLS